MPQDAYTLRRVADELNTALKGGRINKIVQPSKDEVALIIYTGKGTVKLILNTNASDCGAYFGEREENPPVAPNFCMLLRKHLSGAEVLSVSLTGFERVMRFDLFAGDEFVRGEKTLFLEVMGKYSNLLLVEKGMILGALKMNSLDDGSKRPIFAGVKYTLPAKQDKADPSDEAALAAALSGADGSLGTEETAHLLFTRLAGIAPVTARQIAEGFRGGSLEEHVRYFLFEAPTRACVLFAGKGDFFAFAGKGDFFANEVEGAVPYPSLLAAETAFYARKRSEQRFEAERRKLRAALAAALKKAEKKLAVLLEKKLSCADAEENRKKGELITANIWALKRGMKWCELPDYSDPAGGTVKILLDEKLSPADNAQSYFRRYRKQIRALEMLAPQERETREDAEYYRSLLAHADSASEREDLLSLAEELAAAGLLPAPKEKKKKPEIPFRTYEREGFTVLAGRNNLQNDRLVRSSSPEDIWLHAQRYHSCHVVVKTNGREPPLSVLQFAANVCARYSDGGGDRIPVDYTKLKHVKKPKGSKAGFVTYTDFRTLLGSPSDVL